ncbi:uncharacterized protein LOC110431331 isoform X2 [Sorghum bicolor]|uniref:uncharacterized protein LOC110431331 isoform X2 n=1 Tax=Sorghum bicolor TaxID=4558 RepID=UPI000B425729|nr:uncharacterized protein LOC110431331 isoform X2 [Sorghum bicolor]|eukprot:XP_021306036.1 uncharacterized protein LOC110431331 isoform X2 [Sorghum bicolor]
MSEQQGIRDRIILRQFTQCLQAMELVIQSCFCEAYRDFRNVKNIVGTYIFGCCFLARFIYLGEMSRTGLYFTMQTSVEASFSFLFEMNSRRELRTILNNEESRPSNTTELQQRGRLKAIKPRKRIIIVGGALQGARTRIENGDRHRKHERHQSFSSEAANSKT